MPPPPLTAADQVAAPHGLRALGVGRAELSGGSAAPSGTPSLASPDREVSNRYVDEACRFWRQASSCLISLVLHALLVILLGLWFFPQRPGNSMSLTASMSDLTGDTNGVDASEFTAETDEQQPSSEAAASTLEQTASDLTKSIAADAKSTEVTPPTPTEQRMIMLNGTHALVPYSGNVFGGGEELGGGDADVTGALGGRGKGVRARLASEGGGSPASEDAVSRGLRWLQAHQLANGGWCFDLKKGPCEGRCRDSGTEVSTTGATALALLAFLGRGETHKEGDYQENVQRGIYYLTSQMRVGERGGDLRGESGGTMYSHGIATIALCEAYAMTRDPNLEPYAQKAIDFIVNAQDPRTGGWRYEPRMPGDTTVSGWQIMALKSGQMAYLRVPYETIERADHFVDTVQLENGARYGYLPRLKEGRELTTSSVGLLCRMYMGWPLDRPALDKGIGYLAQEGPSMLGEHTNIYYNYYATQVMHHVGGERWQTWNNQMRDYLVAAQSKQGHESGSWYSDGGQARAGGRLYVTAMAIMTLEVYYRHLPLYAQR